MSSFRFHPRVNSTTRICVQLVYLVNGHKNHSGGGKAGQELKEIWKKDGTLLLGRLLP